MIKNKELWILLTVVALDLVTKLLTNNYLPFEQDISIIENKLSLYLTYNQGATGGHANFLLQSQKDKNTAIILSCINGLLLMTYILYIRTRSFKKIYKVIIGIILFVILSIVTEIMLPILAQFNITSWTASVFGNVAGLILYCTLFYFAKDKLARLSLVFILACGIGNLLNHFYSPFLIIDFIYVKGLYELLKIGIFNLADLSFYIGEIGLMLFFLIWILRKFTARKLDNTKSAN